MGNLLPQRNPTSYDHWDHYLLLPSDGHVGCVGLVDNPYHIYRMHGIRNDTALLARRKVWDTNFCVALCRCGRLHALFNPLTLLHFLGTKIV